MALIEWNDEFALGIPDHELDHRELIDLINGLYEQLHSGMFGVTVVEFLEGVYAGTQEHFVREEQTMIDDAYPDYEAHKADHERFLSKIDKLIREYQDGVLTEEAAMVLWFTHWFQHHLQNHDARLAVLLDRRR
jgi:hemerythrin-like metal-binding protein